ncbi:MAG: HAD family hydrolase [Anaerolineales bacterium]
MPIQLIAFDADDTLWENEALYHRGRARFRALLAPYGIAQVSDEALDEIEIGNLPLYGYGVMGFVLSLIEAAVKITDGRVTGAEVEQLLDLGKEMLGAEVVLFEHVEGVLRRLREQYPLMLITKGDLNHQQSKVSRSGLQENFRYVEVVSEKNPEIYAEIFQRRGCAPENILMVGNSLRSDILPVLALGSMAVYIPQALNWTHESAEAPDGTDGRFFELPHIGLLPELLEQITAEQEA